MNIYSVLNLLIDMNTNEHSICSTLYASVIRLSFHFLSELVRVESQLNTAHAQLPVVLSIGSQSCTDCRPTTLAANPPQATRVVAGSSRFAQIANHPWFTLWIIFPRPTAGRTANSAVANEQHCRVILKTNSSSRLHYYSFICLDSLPRSNSQKMSHTAQPLGRFSL